MGGVNYSKLNATGHTLSIAINNLLYKTGTGNYTYSYGNTLEYNESKEEIGLYDTNITAFDRYYNIRYKVHVRKMIEDSYYEYDFYYYAYFETIMNV